MKYKEKYQNTHKSPAFKMFVFFNLWTLFASTVVAIHLITYAMM